MPSVLVAYTTNSGSTEEVAQAIGQELGKDDRLHVDVRRVEEVTHLDSYNAVVVGAPMILGWHRGARNFLRKNQAVLAGKRVAYFCTAMSLTQTGEQSYRQTPVWVDPELAKPPQRPGRLTFKENYATLANYLKPIFDAAPGVQPLSVGMFGGKMEMFRLPFFQMLFVMVIIQAQPGDLRNWPLIDEWAADLRTRLIQEAGE